MVLLRSAFRELPTSASNRSIGIGQPNDLLRYLSPVVFTLTPSSQCVSLLGFMHPANPVYMVCCVVRKSVHWFTSHTATVAWLGHRIVSMEMIASPDGRTVTDRRRKYPQMTRERRAKADRNERDRVLDKMNAGTSSYREARFRVAAPSLLALRQVIVDN